MTLRESLQEYTPEFELFLKSEAEQLECFSILHNLSSIKYNKYSIYLNIPIIILSSFIGILTASNLLQNVIYSNIILGSINIIAAILKTIDSYFQFSKLSEMHRVMCLQYSKIHKLIFVQLSLERNSRINAEDLLTRLNNEVQNMKDIEPIIKNDIIKSFNEKYKTYNNSKPAICNGLSKIIINHQRINRIDSIVSQNSPYPLENIKN